MVDFLRLELIHIVCTERVLSARDVIQTHSEKRTIQLVKNALLLLLWTCAMATVDANPEQWPQWRRPTFNGLRTEKNLPLQWNAEENIAWKRALRARILHVQRGTDSPASAFHH